MAKSTIIETGAFTQPTVTALNTMFTDLYGSAYTVAAGQAVVGNSAGVGTPTTISGDIALSSAGVVTANALTIGQVANVSLTAGQITTLNSVPVTIVAAPGAGLGLVFEDLLFSFTYNSVQFTGGGTLQLQYNGSSTNVMISTVPAATVTGTANVYVSFGPASTANGVVITANKALELKANTADFAAGNSTAKVSVRYRVVTL